MATMRSSYVNTPRRGIRREMTTYQTERRMVPMVCIPQSTHAQLVAQVRKVTAYRYNPEKVPKQIDEAVKIPLTASEQLAALQYYLNTEIEFGLRMSYETAHFVALVSREYSTGSIGPEDVPISLLVSIKQYGAFLEAQHG